VCWKAEGSRAKSAAQSCGQEGEKKRKKRDNSATPGADAERVWRVTPSRALYEISPSQNMILPDVIQDGFTDAKLVLHQGTCFSSSPLKIIQQTVITGCP